MRLTLVPAPRLPAVPAWAAAAAGAWGAGVLALHALDPAFATCRFHAATGLPCPTCGGTRAVACALHGDVGGALSANPLLFLALLVVVGVLALRLLVARRVSLRVARGEARFAWLLAAALVAADWVYLLSRGV